MHETFNAYTAMYRMNLYIGPDLYEAFRAAERCGETAYVVSSLSDDD